MKKTFFFLWILFTLMNESCNQPDTKKKTENPTVIFESGTFGYDLHFLSRYDSIVLLRSEDGASALIVSPKYQGKVFTSTAAGDEGKSFGWINYPAFDAPVNEHMNAYGGENRFWLGPEGGHFSLFFKKDSAMVFSNWHTPAGIDHEPWEVISSTASTVELQKNLELFNYRGTELKIAVKRSISLLDKKALAASLGMEPGPSVKAVGYETLNTITNKGEFEWTELTGMPCIWILDMFRPSPSTVIVVPYQNPEKDSIDKIATTNYFGQIPPDRVQHRGDILFFKADGKSRGKLGIKPNKARPVAGSYDQANQILTIVQFDLDARAHYLNQEWNTTKPPFSGDAVNAYNDGPLADGSQMGPFYEIESVSPAAFLKPLQSLAHKQTVFHFTGSEQELDVIAKKILGVSLPELAKIF